MDDGTKIRVFKEYVFVLMEDWCNCWEMRIKFCDKGEFSRFGLRFPLFIERGSFYSVEFIKSFLGHCLRLSE